MEPIWKSQIEVEIQEGAIFISDVHIGSIGCKSEELFKFLKECEKNKIPQLFLVGDIIDGWKLNRKFRIRDYEMKIIRKILKFAKNGTEVYYVPGNHDEFLREFDQNEIDLSGITIVDSIKLLVPFTVATIKNTNEQVDLHDNYLVIHGDQFDSVMQYHKWIALFGDKMYEMLLRLNHWIYKSRKYLGMSNWSLSKYVKQSVKTAVSYITRFEEVAVKYLDETGYVGIICGHIHSPADRKIPGKNFEEHHYLNCGDWIEVCSYIKWTRDEGFSVVEHLFNNQGDKNV